jgi:hypothetical protein
MGRCSKRHYCVVDFMIALLDVLAEADSSNGVEPCAAPKTSADKRLPWANAIGSRGRINRLPRG